MGYWSRGIVCVAKIPDGYVRIFGFVHTPPRTHAHTKINFLYECIPGIVQPTEETARIFVGALCGKFSNAKQAEADANFQLVETCYRPICLVI
jgi:hypothetical protein